MHPFYGPSVQLLQEGNTWWLGLASMGGALFENKFGGTFSEQIQVIQQYLDTVK